MRPHSRETIFHVRNGSMCKGKTQKAELVYLRKIVSMERVDIVGDWLHSGQDDRQDGQQGRECVAGGQ